MYIQGGLKKTWFIVLEGYPVKIYKNMYDVFPYMNTIYFHLINQFLSFKLKAQFTARSFQKAVALHLL